jgi:hypothetical protein
MDRHNLDDGRLKTYRPLGKLLGRDKLLVELHHVGCEENQNEACISNVLVAEVEGWWLLGIWPGRLINMSPGGVG